LMGAASRQGRGGEGRRSLLSRPTFQLVPTQLVDWLGSGPRLTWVRSFEGPNFSEIENFKQKDTKIMRMSARGAEISATEAPGCVLSLDLILSGFSQI